MRFLNHCKQLWAGRLVWTEVALLVFSIGGPFSWTQPAVHPVAPAGTVPVASTTIYLPIAASGSDVTAMRPYTANSPWNTPIGSNPTYDSHSTEMVATIGLDGGTITSDPSQYSYPVYFVDATTPRWTVPCTVHNCTVVTPTSDARHAQLDNVPIPPQARPSQGTDGQMIIIDKATYTEYDFWQVTKTANGWSVSNGTVYNILWDGMAPNYGSRGAGVPYLAGLIRPWEIRQGHIDHAIAFSYPNPAAERCVFPASKSDGRSQLPYAIPDGARLQLDPNLSDADLDRLGLDRTGKIIAHALQQYGMILIDNSGRSKILAEDLANNPYATEQWSDPALHLTRNSVANLPYTAFRVLALPSAYWNATPNAPHYGDCFAYSQ